MALNPQMSPGSNHSPCQVEGAGMAILAVRGDPGSDEAQMARLWKGVEANAIRGLTEGFGDYGHGPRAWQRPACESA